MFTTTILQPSLFTKIVSWNPATFIISGPLHWPLMILLCFLLSVQKCHLLYTTITYFRKPGTAAHINPHSWEAEKGAHWPAQLDKTNKQTKNRRNDSMPRYIRPTKLNQEEARNLNRSVTSKEIGTAIKSLPKGETQNRTDRRIHSNSSYMLPAMLLKPPIVERKNCWTNLWWQHHFDAIPCKDTATIW